VNWLPGARSALLALLATLPLGGGGPVAGFRTTRDVTMRIYVPAGKLVVRTWDRDSIDVRGVTGPNARFFGGGTRTHVKLGVEAASPRDSTLPTADWQVMIPRASRVWIKVIDAVLDVRGTEGELEAYAVRGRITVANARGTTSLESIDAPVTVRDVGGDLRVRGGKGAVDCDSVSGMASVSTISGAVTLARFLADARVETIGGDVTLRGGIGRGTTDVQTHGGRIVLAFPAAAVPQLDLQTRAGPVQGDVRGGSAAHGRVTARSFKGAIVVTRDGKR